MSVILKDVRPTKTVSLPSFEGSEVVFYSAVLLSDMLEANKQDGDKGVGLHLLHKVIKSWNFVDEENKPVPVNAETIGKLPVPDAEFLLKEVAVFAQAQKKT